MFWEEPGRRYFDEALDELRLSPDDLEDPRPMDGQRVPMGVYPNLDRVYTRAWELRETT